MTSTETTTELAAFKATVRETADEYLRGGYGSRDEWNKLLVHCGLEPLSTKKAKLTLPVSGTIEKSLDAAPNRTEDWYRENAAAFIAAGDLGKLDTSGISVEFVDETPGVEGEEASPQADTEDLKVYKRLVYREGLRLQQVFGWCESGTSDVFERVGLPRINSISIPVDVTLTARIRAFAPGAMDEDEAREMLANGELTGAIEASARNNHGQVKLVGAEPADPSVFMVNDPDPTGWSPERGNRAYRVREDGRCGVEDPSTGYGCTWRDHSHETDHVAGSYGTVVAVFPRA